MLAEGILAALPARVMLAAAEAITPGEYDVLVMDVEPRELVGYAQNLREDWVVEVELNSQVWLRRYDLSGVAFFVADRLQALQHGGGFKLTLHAKAQLGKTTRECPSRKDYDFEHVEAYERDMDEHRRSREFLGMKYSLRLRRVPSDKRPST
jgi:hypothetical protein